MLFLKLMQEGGPMMWVILGCSVIALFIFLIKFFQFHREEISVRELLRGLFNVLQREGLVEALTLCDHTPGPVARLLGAGILAWQRGDEDIRREMDNIALEEIPRLERYINFLGTLGFILPILGFLGTVLGMLNAFETVRGSESFSASDIAGGVSMALISTAAALSVAIPCYVAYNYLVGRVNSLVLDMEKAALELAGFFERRRIEKQKNSR